MRETRAVGPAPRTPGDWMMSASRAPRAFRIGIFAAATLLAITPLVCADNDDCLMCHEDPDLVAESGHSVGVDADAFGNSVHADLDCVDCHEQPGDYEDFPHFAVYKKVDCSSCHDEAAESYASSFHGVHSRSDRPDAPTCASCHGAGGSPHAIGALDLRSAEKACQRCHKEEAKAYDGSVHFRAAKAGKMSPGCVTCHPAHSSAMPPAAGAVDHLCEGCHEGTMDVVQANGHLGEMKSGGTMSCASCHDVHSAHKPQLDEGVLEACNDCHEGYQDQFVGSVHEDLFEIEEMNCLSCHRGHNVKDALEDEGFGCGNCHDEAEEVYRGSAHRRAQLRGDSVAANCGDCHGGHHVLDPADEDSPVNHFNIPDTCGKCHTSETIVTPEYVRLPVSLPSYLDSIHGIGWSNHEPTAVCTDCHGDHNLYPASDPESTVNKQNIAATCGACHEDVSKEYRGSIHGRALAMGVSDSPSCVDCHDEHLILPPEDPCSTVNAQRQAESTCGKCHENPEMAARFGLSDEVVGSYKDSYHGWALRRQCQTVATCKDCHNAHDIRSPQDPDSSVHQDNVTFTCGKCHEASNPQFAQSYSHESARDQMLIHDWVRVTYIGLILMTLGGMFLHNALIFFRRLKTHKRDYHAQPTVDRMNRNEIIQHLLLAVTFSVLAITGFALRFPDSWWTKILAFCGMDEDVRRIIHRTMAFGMTATSLYHIYYMIATRRGRMLLRAIFPKYTDVIEAFQNIMYYLGLRKSPPRYALYDYTQKMEYWALVWGTIVMTVTGIVLMYPDFVTAYFPAWVVRVCETIHFYEAILAVGAIIIWHFFFTIVLPEEYPMSWIWITGKMTKHHADHHHPRAHEDLDEDSSGDDG